MTNPLKTQKGFAVCRRCDSCGARICAMVVDKEEECTLKCQRCGQEYRFFVRDYKT